MSPAASVSDTGSGMTTMSPAAMGPAERPASCQLLAADVRVSDIGHGVRHDDYDFGNGAGKLPAAGG